MNKIELTPAEVERAVEYYLNSEVFQVGEKVVVKSLVYIRDEHREGKYIVKLDKVNKFWPKKRASQGE